MDKEKRARKKEAFERENMKLSKYQASTPGVKNSSSKHAMVYGIERGSCTSGT